MYNVYNSLDVDIDGLGADTLKVYSANDRWLSQFLTSPITYKYHLGGTYAL